MKAEANRAGEAAFFKHSSWVVTWKQTGHFGSLWTLLGPWAPFKGTKAVYSSLLWAPACQGRKEGREELAGGTRKVGLCWIEEIYADSFQGFIPSLSKYREGPEVQKGNKFWCAREALFPFLFGQFCRPRRVHTKSLLRVKTVKNWGTSGQDGGVGRYTLPTLTTKRRTTSSKTKQNQNYQKIKLYGSLTTKQLKKKHSFRLLGGAEMDSWGLEDVWQGGSWRTGWSHICMQIKLEEQLESKTNHATQGSSTGK